MMKEYLEKKHKLFGWIIILVNVLLLYDNLHLYYLYNYTGILFMFMYPNWSLLVGSLLNTIGVMVGMTVIKKRLKASHGIIIVTCLILIGILLKHIPVTF